MSQWARKSSPRVGHQFLGFLELEGPGGKQGRAPVSVDSQEKKDGKGRAEETSVEKK